MGRRAVRAVHEVTPARPVGRPCKLTPDVQARICAVLAVGGTYKLAAIAGGVSQSGLRQWLERGRRVAEWAEQRDAAGEPADIAEDDRPYVELVQATDAAMLKPALVALQAIQAAAKEGDWRAGLAWLERRYPKDYGAQLTQKLDALGEGSERKIVIVHSDEWRGAENNKPIPDGAVQRSPAFETREELEAWRQAHGDPANQRVQDEREREVAATEARRRNRQETIRVTAGERIIAETTFARRRQDAPAAPQVAAERAGLQQHTAALATVPAPAQSAQPQPTPQSTPARSPLRRNWYDRTR